MTPPAMSMQSQGHKQRFTLSLKGPMLKYERMKQIVKATIRFTGNL